MKADIIIIPGTKYQFELWQDEEFPEDWYICIMGNKELVYEDLIEEISFIWETAENEVTIHSHGMICQQYPNEDHKEIFHRYHIEVGNTFRDMDTAWQFLKTVVKNYK